MIMGVNTEVPISSEADSPECFQPCSDRLLVQNTFRADFRSASPHFAYNRESSAPRLPEGHPIGMPSIRIRDRVSIMYHPSLIWRRTGENPSSCRADDPTHDAGILRHRQIQALHKGKVP